MSERAPSQSLWAAFSSWRVGAVWSLSFSSGLPAGLIFLSFPWWMSSVGVDIKTVGVLTLAQAPYAFKFLWSPLMDRYFPPFLGRKRGWVLLTQVALAMSLGVLAWNAASPTVAFVAVMMVLISFAAASQDIAYDAYAVEVLQKHEHGAATSLRAGMYRLAMYVSGNAVISFGPELGWPVTIGGIALLFLALTPITIFAPEPTAPPKSTTSLRAALWEPFVAFLSRPRALEIAALLVCYKLSDTLATALIRPFLTAHGYDKWDVGIGTGIAVTAGIMAGAVVGAAVVNRLGVVRALWIFGVVQAFATLGYALLAAVPPNRPLLYLAVSVENFASGLGSGAFGVLLLQLTDKRFSATQFALLSSLVGLGRTISGPPAGALAATIGWSAFFLLCMPAAIPGLLLLQRVAPWRKAQSLKLSADEAELLAPGAPWPTKTLWMFGGSAALVGTSVGLLGVSLLNALGAVRDGKAFDYVSALETTLSFSGASATVDLVGSVIFGLLCGFAVAAFRAARGQRRAAQAAP